MSDAMPPLALVRGLSEKFWSRVDATGDCWEWIGTITDRGYGRLYTGGRAHRAHRIAWELMVAAIPAGLEIDHLCFHRKCVNPDHLDVVTQDVNKKRGRKLGRCPDPHNTKKTHCPQGHPYDEDNTVLYWRGTTTGKPRRYCKTCQRDHKRAYKMRQRAAKNL